ncbi:MAG TPA: AEC family transporter, partial [Propionibacteriaceae bacterium]|nr:AEC family transporter [Propionibacteriaceae bacterium]
MASVLSGFFTIWAIIGVGWFLAHVGVFTVENQLQMSRLSFFVGSPALLVVLLQKADLQRLFSASLIVSIAAIAIAGGVYLVLAAVFFRPTPGDKVIGTFAACYVNAGNLGIP